MDTNLLRNLAAYLFGGLLCLWLLPVLAQQQPPTVPPHVANNTLSGKTARFVSDKFGNGVLYFAADGRAWLWYPGQPDITLGQWQVQNIHGTMGAKAEAFSYDIIALNFPNAEDIHRIEAARTRIGRYISLDATQLEQDLAVAEAAEGDILRLASGKPPCRLCRAEMTFAQMLTGRGP